MKPPAPTTRLIATPGGTAKLEIGGAYRYTTAQLTLFDAQGWAIGSEVWQAAEGDRLDAFLARVTGLQASEAARHASELVARWRDSGNAQRDRRMLLVMGGSVLGFYLVPALFAAFITRAVMRRRRTSRRRTSRRDRGWLGLRTMLGRNH